MVVFIKKQGMDNFKLKSIVEKEAVSCYIGLDPGMSGGLAAIWSDGRCNEYTKMPETEKDIWEWLSAFRPKGSPHYDIFAVMEQQIPRPTSFFDKLSGKWKSSILKSTCILYANFMQLKALLIAAEIPFEEVPPKKWTTGLSIPPRKKDETDTIWKNRLKAKAIQLFPGEKVTLAVADAMLIATYCRRKRTGTL